MEQFQTLFRGAIAAATAALLLSGCATLPGPAAPAVADACTVVRPTDMTSAFPLSVSDPGRPLTTDAFSNSCVITIHGRSSDASLVITVAGAGPAAMRISCGATSSALSDIGEYACWNPATGSTSALQHGTMYSVAVFNAVFPQDYTVALQNLLKLVVSRR